MIKPACYYTVAKCTAWDTLAGFCGFVGVGFCVDPIRISGSANIGDRIDVQGTLDCRCIIVKDGLSRDAMQVLTAAAGVCCFIYAPEGDMDLMCRFPFHFPVFALFGERVNTSRFICRDRSRAGLIMLVRCFLVSMSKIWM